MASRRAVFRTRLTGALYAVWMLIGDGCVWLDDFDKFTVVDAGSRSDASTAPDAAPDARTGQDASDAEDAGRPCSEGAPCFDDNPCTQNDRCTNGTCVGELLDCAALDDECSQGVCDPELGGCTFGPNRMSQSCDDANPCTADDRCSDRGLCESTSNAPEGAACSDYNDCTGTSSAADHCNGSGRCVEGAAVAAGTACDDQIECTSDDHCDGDGVCGGDPVREGAPCQGACTANTRCHAGACVTEDNAAPAYNPRCVLMLCGAANICRSEWMADRVCHCGCGFIDPDCTDCSARMCQSDTSLGHSAVRWCDTNGRAVNNCPASLKGDGHCDCGCQFADPDCGGGACCSATGKAGCDNAFVQDCVCQHETNPDPSCCTEGWTDRCASLAVSLGCAVCP